MYVRYVYQRFIHDTTYTKDPFVLCKEGRISSRANPEESEDVDTKVR